MQITRRWSGPGRRVSWSQVEVGTVPARPLNVSSLAAMAEAMPDRWTTHDFDALSWHDCHVHGLRFGEANEEYGSIEFELDIDFIVEWLRQGEQQAIHFRIAPATLTFHDVTGLRVLLDYVAPTAGMTPFSIDGIERVAVTYGTGHTSYRWRLPVNWPAGEITFESPGFTQVLRREPVATERQRLTPSERCG